MATAHGMQEPCQRCDDLTAAILDLADGLEAVRELRLEWRCRDCSYRPVGTTRPATNTCPQCRGDFTWEEA